MVERMLNLSCKEQERNYTGGAVVLGTLFLFSYVFLLRVPSEALPAQAHHGGAQCAVHGERAAGAHAEEKIFSLFRRVIAV